MKIAVTGGNGFVGRHVLAELKKYTIETIAVLRSTHSLGLVEREKINIIEIDIYNLPEKAFEYIGSPDVLIHLAWHGLPNYHSLHHFEQELPKQYEFLQRVVKAGLKSLVVTGTCFEYGMHSGMLQESMTAAPANSYGFAKDVLRQQLQYLQQTTPFSLTWARLFYLYGSGQAESSLLPQLRNSVEQGEKLFNMSGGEQLRDYLPASEVARYLVSLAINKKNIGVINICSGKPISIRNLVEEWVDNNNWDIKLNFGHYPYPDYEPMAFWGDRCKLDNYLESHESFQRTI